MRWFMAEYDLIQEKLHLYWERTWLIILRDISVKRYIGWYLKNHIIFQILYIYCRSSIPLLSQTLSFLQSSSTRLCSDWPRALWLAEHRKHEKEI